MSDPTPAQKLERAIFGPDADKLPPRECIPGWLDTIPKEELEKHQPSPLESSPDAAEEWNIDAQIAEANNEKKGE